MPDIRRIADDDIHAAIERVAAEISQRHPPAEHVFLLGIANGGIEFANRLKARLPQASYGVLDISFHRDDIGRNPIPKEFIATQILGDIDGAVVILADDVLFSGRTVKAALDELFDHGRPAKVELAVLVDRGGRKLPIVPDYCGLQISAKESEKVVVRLHASQPSHDLVTVRSS